MVQVHHPSGLPVFSKEPATWLSVRVMRPPIVRAWRCVSRSQSRQQTAELAAVDCRDSKAASDIERDSDCLEGSSYTQCQMGTKHSLSDQTVAETARSLVC